jgi:signal transduction histidine kinase
MTLAAHHLVTDEQGRLRLPVAASITVVGIAVASVTGWVVGRSPVLVYPLSDAIVRAAYVAVYVAVGAYTWYRRPGGRLGPLLMANAVLVALYALNASDQAVPWAIGMMLWALWIAFTAYLYLSFPRGRLETPVERALVGALAASTAVVWGLALVFAKQLPAAGEFSSCGGRCPDNPFRLATGWAGASSTLNLAYGLSSTISLIGIAILIFAKARGPGRLRRRALEPLSYVLVASILEFVLAVFFIEPSYPGTTQTFRVVDAALVFAIPVAMLVGQARGRVFAATRGGQMVASLQGAAVTPEQAQELLRDALGDPSLVLVLGAPEGAGYVDSAGRPLELPRSSTDRTTTVLLEDGRPLAALVHDALLDIDSSTVRGLTATALMLIENTRLLDEVRQSRRRLLALSHRERIRLERDLHDGAAQRLLAVQIQLDLLGSRLGGELADEVAAISDHTLATLDEIRQVSRDIYPTVLRDFGLRTALLSAAFFLPLDVHVAADDVERLDASIEATVYFCVLEALRNVVECAGPNARATVDIRCDQGVLTFTIAAAGAALSADSAVDSGRLLSVRDRVEALGGTLTIRSQPGDDTTVTGSIPTEQPLPLGTLSGSRARRT